MVDNAATAEEVVLGAIEVELAGASVTMDGAKLVCVGVGARSDGPVELEAAD